MTRRQALLAAIVGTPEWVPQEDDTTKSGLGIYSTKPTHLVVSYDGREVRFTLKEVMDALEHTPPLPDQCPVCGTMAQPSWLMSQVIRCSHCSNAFWRDAGP